MNSMDLEFTQNEDWIENRTLIWKPIEKNLSTDFSEKEILDVAQYFYTGKPGESYILDDSGKFEYFPLQGKEAWDYILSNIVRKSSVFEDLVKGTLQNRSNEKLFPHMAPYELERWDYFLGETFNAVVKSRVPVGKDKEIVEVSLNPVEVFGDVAAMIMTSLDVGSGGEYPKFFARKNYFFSLLPFLTDECFDKPRSRSKEYRASGLLNYIFQHVVDYKPDREFEDAGLVRKKFLEELEVEMDARLDTLCTKLQEVWCEVKSKKYSENK